MTSFGLALGESADSAEVISLLSDGSSFVGEAERVVEGCTAVESAEEASEALDVVRKIDAASRGRAAPTASPLSFSLIVIRAAS